MEERRPNHAGVPLERIVPHRPPMLFLDEVVAAEDDAIESVWTTPREGPWIEEGQLRGAALVEFAAQTAAARAGLTRWLQGLPPLPGYLGGIDRFHLDAAAPAGSRLHCRVEVRLRIGALARVSCVVRRDGADGPVAGRGELTLATGADPRTEGDECPSRS